MPSMPSANAPITNMILCRQALANAMGRDKRLPGLAVFYGPAGSGKTRAAQATAQAMGATYVQAWPVWTARSLLEALAKELGLMTPAKSVSALLGQVIEALKVGPRPLIIDEMDHLVKKGLVEIIRTLHDATGVPILMIGEEALPARLKTWNRFDSRILSFTPTLPANHEDAEILAGCYAGDVSLDKDLLEYFLKATKGNIRRLSINLSHAAHHARTEGETQLSRKWWGHRPVHTGQAPRAASTIDGIGL